MASIKLECQNEEMTPLVFNQLNCNNIKLKLTCLSVSSTSIYSLYGQVISTCLMIYCFQACYSYPSNYLLYKKSGNVWQWHQSWLCHFFTYFDIVTTIQGAIRCKLLFPVTQGLRFYISIMNPREKVEIQMSWYIWKTFFPNHYNWLINSRL